MIAHSGHASQQLTACGGRSLEVTHGARTLGLSLEAYLGELAAAGLATLPGTAAEILDDEVRSIICPDKLKTEEWLEVMRAAHAVGLKSTATIMFGHVEQPHHWARHLLRIRGLQRETRGFTGFVPLPFVHMEAPLWRKGRQRHRSRSRRAHYALPAAGPRRPVSLSRRRPLCSPARRAADTSPAACCRADRSAAARG
jgi:2-iminoacetate synthase ThiH